MHFKEGWDWDWIAFQPSHCIQFTFTTLNCKLCQLESKSLTLTKCCTLLCNRDYQRTAVAQSSYSTHPSMRIAVRMIHIPLLMISKLYILDVWYKIRNVFEHITPSLGVMLLTISEVASWMDGSIFLHRSNSVEFMDWGSLLSQSYGRERTMILFVCKERSYLTVSHSW